MNILVDFGAPVSREVSAYDKINEAFDLSVIDSVGDQIIDGFNDEISGYLYGRFGD